MHLVFPRGSPPLTRLNSLFCLRIGGELCGDPLDVILFRQTGWLLDEPNLVEESARFDNILPTIVRSPGATGAGGNFGVQESAIEIGIIRQFTFRYVIQRVNYGSIWVEGAEGRGKKEKMESLSAPRCSECR